jgi:hypothetical protein
VFTRRGPSKALAGSFLKANDFADLEPWRSLLDRTTPGILPTKIPVFLAQRTTDNLVIPSITVSYRDKLCRAGSAVRLLMITNVARESAAAAVAWIAERFNGVPSRNNCD